MNFYNRYNLSIHDEFLKSEHTVYWLNKAYPAEVLIILIEAGFRWDSIENCWRTKNSTTTNDAVNKIIAFAEDEKKKANINDNNVVVSTTQFDEIEIKDETDFFFTLKTEIDYQNFLTELNKDPKYIIHLNKDKWDQRRENFKQAIAQDGLVD